MTETEQAQEHDRDDAPEERAGLRSLVDLDAWSPPPPPDGGGLADAVVARLRAPSAAVAGPPEAPPGHRGGRIAAVVAAVVAVAAAGVLAVTWWGGGRGPAEEGAPVGAQPGLQEIQQEVRDLRARLADAERALAERSPGRPAGGPVSAPASKAAPGPAPNATPAPTPAPAPAPAPKTAPAPARKVAPPGCDAVKLGERGRDAFSMGMLAMALRLYEDAVACSPDPLLIQRAFLVACNLGAIHKAAAFHARLTPALRQQVLIACARNGITEDALDAAAGNLGTLSITSDPPARIFIDGQDAGRTPLSTAVPAGRHQVTFEAGAIQRSLTVVAEAGKTVTVHKRLADH